MKASLASRNDGRTFRSVSFTGEWPTGIHWSPDEVRTIPVGYQIPNGPPPAGLEAVGSAEAVGGEG